MSELSTEQQRQLVRTWQNAGTELEIMRREHLRDLAYCWEDVDALLELGDLYKGPPRETSGLVEMQKWFMEFARRQGLAPAVGDPKGTYTAGANESTVSE
jgi:hypothetical protein